MHAAPGDLRSIRLRPTDISRFDVGPPLLFQLHDANDAGLD